MKIAYLAVALTVLAGSAAIANSTTPSNGTLPPAYQACADELPFGVPAVSGPAMQPVCHKGYASAVDPRYLVPRWVSYHLTNAAVLGCLPREEAFHDEDQIAGPRAAMKDYAHSGYDMGHMAPNDDFDSAQEMYDSFSLANMAPQLPELNRQQWKYLEDEVRGWAFGRSQLQVYVGTIFVGEPERIGRHRVGVPAAFWKVIIDRSTNEVMAFGILQKPAKKMDFATFLVPIARVEQLAGIALPLPEGVDRNAVGPIWKSTTKQWRKAKKAYCSKN